MTALNPAQAYEQLYVPAYFRPIGNALLDRLEVSPADRILDEACGTSIVARIIHGRVGTPKRLDGIDINPVMVAAAQTFAPFAQTRLGDAMKLPFGDGDFDVVLCQHGLMFFPDRAAALAEMRRVDAFAGLWAFAGSLTLPDGKAKPLKTRLTCTKAAGGKAVSCTEEGEVVGLGPMHAAYLVGYDTFTKRVHFMAMTSDEAVHDHPCTWKDEHQLACEPLKAGMRGQAITEEFTVSFDGGGAAIKATVILPDGGRMLVDVKGKRT
jgi:SAM-dependent methyltransferase